MDNIALLADNVVPPVGGSVLCIELDTTSRMYDLSQVTFGGRDPRNNDKIFLRLHSDGADTYFFFSDSTGLTVDNTAKLAAGGTVSGFTTSGAARIPDDQDREYIWTAREHRYLYVKGSAAGVLRIHAASCISPG